MTRLVLAAALLSPLALIAREAPEPILVLLVSTIDDHVNSDLSEEGLARTLDSLERLRRDQPHARVSCLFQFTGLTADRLIERRSNGLFDRLGRARAEGLVEVGYNGTDEPTFVARPRPDFRRARTPEDRWRARLAATEAFLTEAKDERLGEPDVTRSGGLRRVQEVFGDLASVAGVSLELGGDPELVHALHRHVPGQPILPGLLDPSTYPARILHGYSSAARMTGTILSPAPDTAPELYWSNGHLRVSRYTDPAVPPLIANTGVDALASAIKLLDRTRPHVLVIEVGHGSAYTKTPFGRRNYLTALEYAYDNPKLAALPDDARRSADERSAAYGRDDAVLRWLATDFLPANAGSRFVSARDLQTIASPVTELSADQLSEAVGNLLREWRAAGTAPPAFVTVRGRYVSLAELFRLLAIALAERAATGSVPPRLEVAPIFGPLLMSEEQDAAVEAIPTSAVARTAGAVARALQESAGWEPLPRNIVPHTVVVEGKSIHAGQFLRLMAEAFERADGNGGVTPCRASMFSSAAELLPRSRPRPDVGTAWTVKPAVLRLPQ